MKESDKNQTPIGKLGKFGFIEHLTERAGRTKKTTIIGVGDDGSEVEIKAQGWGKQH